MLSVIFFFLPEGKNKYTAQQNLFSLSSLHSLFTMQSSGEKRDYLF